MLFIIVDIALANSVKSSFLNAMTLGSLFADERAGILLEITGRPYRRASCTAYEKVSRRLQEIKQSTCSNNEFIFSRGGGGKLN